MAETKPRDDSGTARRESFDAARWVESHGDALFGFALARLHVRAEAEDAVQDTFLAALNARARYRGESGERTWLFGILRHKVIDRLRRRGREVALESDSQADAFIEQTFDETGGWRNAPQHWDRPDEDAEREEFWHTLSGCLGGLPDTLATTFRLMELDGLGTDEACKVLAISPTNVWVRLHRARLRLRECLERQWFGKHAARKGTERSKET